MTKGVDRDAIPAFSRGTESNLIGKCTAELPKVKVPEETWEILTRRAKSAEMTLTEYLRMRAMIDAHGFETVSRMQGDRLRVVAGMGDEKGGEKP